LPRRPYPDTIRCRRFVADDFRGLQAISTFIPIILIDEYVKKNKMDLLAFAILAAIFLVSSAIKWWSELQHWNTIGTSPTRKDLRNWLVMKYVYFSEAVHLEIDNMQFFNVAINQVAETVSHGWYQHFELVAALFDLSIQLALALYLDWHAIMPLALIIPVIVLSIMCKQKKYEDLLFIRMTAENKWMKLMSDIFSNWMLINAYNARDERAKNFKEVYEDFYTKHKASRFFELNYMWITKYTNDVCLALVYVFGAYGCLLGYISVGKFVALIKIFKRIGERLIILSETMIAFQRGIEGLRRVSEMLNHPIGVNQEIEQQMRQMIEAQSNFDKAEGGVPETAAAVDPAAAARPELSEYDTKLESHREHAAQIMTAYVSKMSSTGAKALDQFEGGWSTDMIKDMLSVQLQDLSFGYPSVKGAAGAVTDVRMLKGLNATIPLGKWHQLGSQQLFCRYPPHLTSRLVPSRPLCRDCSRHHCHRLAPARRRRRNNADEVDDGTAVPYQG
jgi:ABC-type multidrug transport system fused ATPase/permease subunit